VKRKDQSPDGHVGPYALLKEIEEQRTKELGPPLQPPESLQELFDSLYAFVGGLGALAQAKEEAPSFEKRVAEFAKAALLLRPEVAVNYLQYLLMHEDEAEAVRELKRLRKVVRRDPATAPLLMPVRPAHRLKGSRGRSVVAVAIPIFCAVDYYGMKPTHVLGALHRKRASDDYKWLRKRLECGRELFESLCKVSPLPMLSRDAARKLPPDERKARALALLRGLRSEKD
jgi:hypothetical protein